MQKGWRAHGNTEYTVPMASGSHGHCIPFINYLAFYPSLRPWGIDRFSSPHIQAHHCQWRVRTLIKGIEACPFSNKPIWNSLTLGSPLTMVTAIPFSMLSVSLIYCQSTTQVITQPSEYLPSSLPASPTPSPVHHFSSTVLILLFQPLQMFWVLEPSELDFFYSLSSPSLWQ